MFWAPSDAPLHLRVICHQKLNSEFVQFFSPHCAAALWQIKFSYHRSLEQRNSSIMYGLRSEILFPLLFCDLIYACLCGSIALVLQYKDKVPQRDRMKRLFEVISKPRLIRLQTRGLNTNVFLPFWIPLLFLDAGGNEDVEMASQNPGINAVSTGAAFGRAGGFGVS